MNIKVGAFFGRQIDAIYLQLVWFRDKGSFLWMPIEVVAKSNA